ncbi:MAG: response regulator [Firmicutes bacterium]|nr:response regulator [Bacillota bacterium]
MEERAGEPIRLLLVDDDVAVRRAVRTFVEWSCPDIEVVGEAGDGPEALRQVQELDPDVVLMDIRMPLMDGLQATRTIKRAWRHRAAVVLMTATSMATVREEGTQAGAVSCLQKPFQLSELRAHLLNAAGRKGRRPADGTPMTYTA